MKQVRGKLYYTLAHISPLSCFKEIYILQVLHALWNLNKLTLSNPVRMTVSFFRVWNLLCRDSSFKLFLHSVA